jgi:two-component system response regulator DegU
MLPRNNFSGNGPGGEPAAGTRHFQTEIGFKDMTILIVEDNPGVRRLLCRAVAELATTVHECSDGCFALAAYMAYQPNVVLMDIRMQTLDGLAATREILHYDPSARVIIVTDYDDEQLRAAAAEAGARAYFLKQNLTDLAPLVAALAR